MNKGAEGLRVEFDRQCSTERRHDPLTILDGTGRVVSVRSGLYVFYMNSHACSLVNYNFFHAALTCIYIEKSE